MQRKVWLIDDQLSQAIDEFRFKRRFRSEAEAVRYLLAVALQAAKEGRDILPQEQKISEEIQDVDRL
jgi:Arc/MetJ-type ribon-helix-helix transcriptional regulator